MNYPSPRFDGSSWSKLPSDLLNMVFERLGFADFQRAKSVCPSWLDASRQSASKNQIPWLIMFPEKGKDYCLLFNSEEKEKAYRIKDLGVEFANSHCLAIYGSWLFMQDPRYNLYIMNLFTRERINLPSVESQFGRIKIERNVDDLFYIKIDDEYDVEYPERHINIDFPLLWIDDKTKHYVVIWSIQYRQYQYLVYYRKGDNWLKHATYCSFDMVGIVDMVYKDHKIYLYSTTSDVKVLEFFGDIPRQIFETQVNYDVLANGVRRVRPELGNVFHIKNTHLVVTMTGETLRVDSIIRCDSDVWSFCIYQMNSSNNKWEKLTSLGDEAILLDQGITVLANAIEGVNRNSIYFSGVQFQYGYVSSEKDICVFNLNTQKVERPYRNISSFIQSCDARWFVPNITRT
ncbi:putative F-box domain-containing protein [Arabidopsis thaliana]